MSGVKRVLIYSGREVDISIDVVKKYFPLLKPLAILHTPSILTKVMDYGFSHFIKKSMYGISPALFGAVNGSLKKFFNPSPSSIKMAIEEYLKYTINLNRLLRDKSFRRVDVWLEWIVL